LCCSLALPTSGQTNEDFVAGPFYSHFKLTLAPGSRREAAGPLYYEQESGTQTQWALPPLLCHTVTPDVDWTEMEILYPLLTYRRFGGEYKLQIMEMLSFSGGQADPETGVKKVTLFPFYFQQRAPDTNLNFTAVVPFYGELKNRLFRDDIKFVMFPLYSETRKKDVVTDNYLFPVFDVRRGDHLRGWQFWPLAGDNRKTPTLHTNSLDEVEIVGGYDRFFAVWPFYLKDHNGLGTTNEESDLTVAPFFSHTDSPLRVQTSYGWPFGYTRIDDRGQKYEERDFFWPLFVKARGSKYVSRAFPIYSHATNASLESHFYAWPFYKLNKLHSAPLERTRMRVIFFLYSDTFETNSESGKTFRRTDLWPIYHHRIDNDGKERWQALAAMEPLFPNNRSILREYSQVWSVWRYEKNPADGQSSRSLLWNLYRREDAPHSKKLSLLFGLFQYQSGIEGRRWRVCYLPAGKKAPTADTH
jgi:hypothetical protein